MMFKTFRALGPALTVLAITAAACGRGGERADQDAMPAMHGGDSVHEMQVDPAMMRRHAEEAAPMVTRTRAHVQEMRGLRPEQWHARMADHSARVSELLNLMTRHMREMDMGMGMGDEAMGAMMGMTGEEHRAMMDAMATVRSDAEQLQTASPADVASRMPAHLDRLGELVQMLEVAAQHMARTLGQRRVIPGWEEGVALMKVGDRVLFTIPSDLAYGPQGRPPVIP